MSIVVAIRNVLENSIYMLADNQTTSGSLSIIEENSFNNKIIKKSSLCVGITGYSKGESFIKDFIENYYIDLSIAADMAIRNLVKALFAYLKKQGLDNKSDGYLDFSGELLIAFSDNIYTVDSLGGITKNNNYAAIGSGSMYAKGYLDSLWNLRKGSHNVDEVANVIVYTCKNITSCGYDKKENIPMFEIKRGE